MNTWSHLLRARSPPGNRPHLGGRGKALSHLARPGPVNCRAAGGPGEESGLRGVPKAKELDRGAGQAGGSGCGHRRAGDRTGIGFTAAPPRAGASNGPTAEGSLTGGRVPSGLRTPRPWLCRAPQAALPPEMSSLRSVPCFNAFSVDVCNV